MIYTIQGFTKTDKAKIISFVNTTRTKETHLEYPSVRDLDELLSIKEITDNTSLFLNTKNELLAYVILDQYNNIWFDADSSFLSEEGSSLIKVASKILHKRALEDEELALDTNCLESNTERIQFLLKAGFVMQEVKTLSYEYKVQKEFPQLLLKSGFTLRSVKGKEEVEALVTLHNQAFGSDNMRVEERLSIMEANEYDKNLDLVVTNEEGELIGSAIASVAEDENKKLGIKAGYIDPIAVHPDYRRMGLASTLIAYGIRELANKGMDVIKFGTSSENEGMMKTAEKMGFTAVEIKAWFKKDLG